MTGLLVCSAGYVVLALAVSSGRPIAAGLEVMMVADGLAAPVCGYGQLFASALSRVRVQDAADASGVLVTMVQLGQVLGVAIFGTVFLSALAARPSAGRLGPRGRARGDRGRRGDGGRRRTLRSAAAGRAGVIHHCGRAQARNAAYSPR